MHIETTSKSQPFHKLISVEFICHGSILKSPEKASKINGSWRGKEFTTPFIFGLEP